MPAANANYAAEIASAQSAATSQFERDVLEDGVITRDEYLEAEELFLACQRDQGIDVGSEESPQGFSHVYSKPTTPEMDTLIEACSVGTTAILHELFLSMSINPENDQAEFNVLMTRCLIRSGLVGTEFTVADFDEFFAQSTEGVVINDDGTISRTPTDSNDRDFGFTIESPEVTACFENPYPKQ